MINKIKQSAKSSSPISKIDSAEIDYFDEAEMMDLSKNKQPSLQQQLKARMLRYDL